MNQLSFIQDINVKSILIFYSDFFFAYIYTLIGIFFITSSYSPTISFPIAFSETEIWLYQNFPARLDLPFTSGALDFYFWGQVKILCMK